MRRSVNCFLALIILSTTNPLLAQNTVLRTSMFDLGFGIVNGASSQAKFSTGEPFTGFAVGNTFAVLSGFISDTLVQSKLTGVEKQEDIPRVFALHQNYPNPFNPTTTIAYELPKRSNVAMIIFNILGQAVATLVDDEKAAGRFLVVWNGRSGAGLQAASGVYFCRIQARSIDDGHVFVDTKKLVLLK